MSRAVLAAALALLLLAAPAAASPTGRVVVSLEPGAALPLRFERLGPSVPQIGLVTIDGAGVSLPLLRRLPGVRAASREQRFTYRYQPDDPSLTTPEADRAVPAGTPLQWPIIRSNALVAWDVTRGDGALVAVIDSGVDAGHPDLAPKIRSTVGDDAGTDEDGHGTHVASLACAAGNNGFGTVGIGLDCGLIVVKTDLTDSDVARGIVAAADAGAHAINLSFGDEGGSRSQPIADALAYARGKGAVLVAAAADEPIEEQGEPANLLQPTGTGADPASNLGLVVTAAAFDDARASFAGRGTQISLGAYGTITADSAGLIAGYPGGTTPRERGTLIPFDPPCRCRSSIAGDDRFAYLAGTSMAAPQVAGVAAMVRNLNPDVGPEETVAILKRTARRPSGTGWEPELGWGLLDAGAAVEAVRTIDRTPPRSKATGPRRPRGRRATIRWTGFDRGRPGLKPSGVARYELLRSRNGGPFRRVIRTTRTSHRVTLRRGARDAFVSVAIDRAGNREGRPSRPDITVRRR